MRFTRQAKASKQKPDCVFYHPLRITYIQTNWTILLQSKKIFDVKENGNVTSRNKLNNLCEERGNQRKQRHLFQNRTKEIRIILGSV